MAFDTLADGYLNSIAQCACFNAEATLARMLEFEAALAQAQATLGLIPPAAAPAIAAACAVQNFDLAAIARETASSSSAVIPMVKELTARVAERDAQAALYVHWGATTQDVMDTATMLQARAGLALLLRSLTSIAALLADLVRAHRDTPMVARTLSQQAGPTTFGYKLAGWLDTLLTSHARLQQLRSALPLQFGGAVGTLAALGTRGLELRDALAARLGLRAVLPWHTDRTPVRDLGSALAMLAASAGKSAHDLLLMMQTEVGEVREAGGAGRGGSSALPHKHNPVATIAVTAGALRAPGLLATLFASFEHAHERAAGAWHAEGVSLRELFITVGGMLEQWQRALCGLEVDASAMRANLARTRGLVMAEAAAMALAARMGRERAQSLVKSAVETAALSRRDLGSVLAELPPAVAELGSAGLARALDPSNYLGVAGVLTDQVLARYESARRMS